jgi:hypothetical protein
MTMGGIASKRADALYASGTHVSHARIGTAATLRSSSNIKSTAERLLSGSRMYVRSWPLAVCCQRPLAT